PGRRPAPLPRRPADPGPAGRTADPGLEVDAPQPHRGGSGSRRLAARHRPGPLAAFRAAAAARADAAARTADAYAVLALVYLTLRNADKGAADRAAAAARRALEINPKHRRAREVQARLKGG